jgi:hypothetical protein
MAESSFAPLKRKEGIILPFWRSVFELKKWLRWLDKTDKFRNIIVNQQRIQWKLKIWLWPVQINENWKELMERQLISTYNIVRCKGVKEPVRGGNWGSKPDLEPLLFWWSQHAWAIRNSFYYYTIFPKKTLRSLGFCLLIFPIIMPNHTFARFTENYSICTKIKKWETNKKLHTTWETVWFSQWNQVWTSLTCPMLPQFTQCTSSNSSSSFADDSKREPKRQFKREPRRNSKCEPRKRFKWERRSWWESSAFDAGQSCFDA